jgi:hypothetical protein
MSRTFDGSGTMKKLVAPLLIALTGVAAGQPAAAPYATMAPVQQYLITDREAEVALARTAAPPSISASAGVLVLGPHGYESAGKGSNGFVCFVERSWTAGFADPQFWNPRIRAPNCFNPPAVRSVLPQYLKRTEWALAGTSRGDMEGRARAAFADHSFPPPEPGSFSFMLSKQGYLNDDADGPWLPHVMFFLPSGQAPVWAAGLKGSPIYGSDGQPFEPTVLFIPVPRWSDGSPTVLPGPAQTHSH